MMIAKLQYVCIIDVLKKELIIAMFLFGCSSPDISTCENIELSCKLISIDEQKILSLLDSEEKQKRNNLEKSDDYPFFNTKITSRGNENVKESQSWQILETRQEQ